MASNFPEPARVYKAIDIYVQHAYGGQLPLTARSLVNMLRSWAGEFYEAPAFARTGEANLPRLTLRLGNSFYPHMKLALEPAPDGQSYLFKADSHDKHLCPPPNHPDHAAFMELRGRNQKLAEQIEQAWAEADLETFKTYLKADLERRISEKAT